MSDIFSGRDDEAAGHFRSAETAREQALPKRFYKIVSVQEGEGGFEVRLDDRPIRTPGRLLLSVSTREVADAIAAEWEAQVERIDPMRMPATRLANTAIEGVTDRSDDVRADIVRYAGSDLACYRAEAPDGLVERESMIWDPYLRWAQDGLGANFITGAGVIAVAQPEAAVRAISDAVDRFDDPFQLAGLHVMTALTGSAIIALAVAHGQVNASDGWAAAHVEEDWNIDRWGFDEEAAARRSQREVDMLTAAFFATSGSGTSGGV